jgi:hypothetical protein
MLWAQSVLVRFNSRPVAVELRKSSPALFSSSRLQTKEEQVGAMCVNQLRDFVATLTETKGKRTKDDQNALDVVLAAMIHPSVFGMKLGRTVQNLLGVSWTMIVRAIKCRKDMGLSRHWKPKATKTCRNTVTEEHVAIISKCLHEDPAVAKDDNARKGDLIVLVGTDSENREMCEEHPHKEFLMSKKDLTRHFQKSEAYKIVAASLPKKTLAHGKKRTPRQKRKPQATWKLLKKATCPCLRFPKAPNVCSCKPYTLFEQMNFRCNKHRTIWHQAKGGKIVDGVQKRSCKSCKGKCHQNSVHRRFTASPQTAMSALTCKPKCQHLRNVHFYFFV